MMAGGSRTPGVYAGRMPDDTPAEAYPLSMRAIALLGLFALGALAYILLDIASNGVLGNIGCKDCGNQETADA